MTPATLLASARSLIEGNPDAHGLLDRCNLISRTEVADGFGGTTVTETTTASNVPLLYEDKTYGNSQVGGQSLEHVTHDLFLTVSAATRAIASHYKIVVLARDSVAQFTFEQPVQLGETLGPLVHLGAAKKE